MTLQNSIDNVKKDIMMSVEKHYRKWVYGAIDYFPDAMMWKFKRETWKLVEMKLQGGKVYSWYIRRRTEHFGIEAMK